MSDLGAMIDTCQAETNQPGEEAAFRRHIIAALKHYRPYRFIFSEKSVQFTLVPGKDEYKPGGETLITPGDIFLHFPSDPALVSFGNVFNMGSDSFSVSCRFRTSTIGELPLVYNDDPVTPGGVRAYGLSLRNNGDVQASLGTLANNATPPVSYADGAFHDFTGSFDRLEKLLYLFYDREPLGTPLQISAAGDADGSAFKWGLFITSLNDHQQFLGDIERVAFWNKAVGETDISKIMEWKPAEDIPASVIGFWPLLERTGSSITDYVTSSPNPGPGGPERARNGQASPLVEWGNDDEVFQVNFPGDIMEFDQVRRQIGTRSSVPLDPVSIGELRELQASGLAFGQPDYYCWHHNRFIVWPRPTAAHVLTLDYHFDATRDEETGLVIPPMAEPSVTNEFFRRGEELLRTRALYTFALGRDDDYELAKRMKILNQESERSLFKQRDIMKVDGHRAAFHF